MISRNVSLWPSNMSPIRVTKPHPARWPCLDLAATCVADFRHGANLFAFRFRTGRGESSAGPPQARKLEAGFSARQEAPVQAGTRALRGARQRGTGSESGACEDRKS